jgi:phosphohistidine phosphatase
MKTLLVLRHAKASSEDSSLADFDRPLNERGRRAADLMGRFLRKKKLCPDLVLSSTAARARETIGLVLESARLVVEVRYEQRLYLASAERLAEIILQIEEDRNQVMLVGHNPGMEELLPRLIGTAAGMPTAALAKIVLDVEKWTDSSRAGSGRLEWLMTPKELQA